MDCHCENRMSRSNNVLPGQVQEIEAVAEELAYSCVVVDDDDSDITPRRSITPLKQRSMAVDSPGNSTLDTSSESIGLNANFRSTDSLLEAKKKKFPALTVCKKPKKVKTAMLESLLVAVPSLRRVNSCENEKCKPRICTTPSSFQSHRFFELEGEEAAEESVLHRLYSSDGSVFSRGDEKLESEYSSDSFSTVRLFDKEIGAFERQRILSSVDESPEDE